MLGTIGLAALLIAHTPTKKKSVDFYAQLWGTRTSGAWRLAGPLADALIIPPPLLPSFGPFTHQPHFLSPLPTNINQTSSSITAPLNNPRHQDIPSHPEYPTCLPENSGVSFALVMLLACRCHQIARFFKWHIDNFHHHIGLDRRRNQRLPGPPDRVG